MQLLRLEVRNWVHHRHRVCEFTRGLVAILGENGSGKSSLFGALRWLLTGDNPNYGSKADNISQYAKEGEPSYATLEFEHAGHIAVVTRHLLPEKEQATLTIDGVEAGRGEKGVTAGIEKLIGVDAKFISRFIIVGQTEIFSFIDDSQADTDKFFQRLFNTAKADKCQDLIGKNLAKISIPELAVTAAELETQCVGAQEKLGELEKALAALPTMAQFFRQQEEAQGVIDAWRARESAVTDLNSNAAQMVTTTEAIKTVTEECERHAADLQALDAASAGQEEAITAARTALGHWESYKRVAESRGQIQERRQSLADQRAKDPQPEKPGPLSADELAKDINSRDKRDKELSHFVRMFDENGEAECPTCHTPSSQLADKVAQCKAELDPLRKESAELAQAWGRQLDLEKAWKLWENREKERALQEHKLDAAEQSLQAVPAPSVTENELQQAVGDYDSFQNARKAIAPLAEKANLRRAQLQGAMTGFIDTAVKLQTQIKDATVSEADVNLANSAIKALREQLAQRTVLEVELAEAQYQLRALSEKHTQAVSDEHKAVKMRQWLVTAERAREALKNAPRIVAQRNLQRLETSINELLQVFQVNFQVKVADDGTPTFIAEFYDGRRQVAQRLSIGQKTVLALAFRVAVNAMFAEEIGLLALDEPTAALDQPRIRALAPVLEKLRELSTSKGLQCLLVTHATSLSNLFESAIELEPPELRHVTSG
jgi:DNA repair exonuclease SbcCD ATPase subunit